MHVFWHTRNRAVDAFTRQQYQTLDVVRFAKCQQGSTPICMVRQINKLVKGRSQKSSFSRIQGHDAILP